MLKAGARNKMLDLPYTTFSSFRLSKTILIDSIDDYFTLISKSLLDLARNKMFLCVRVFVSNREGVWC